MMTIILVCEEIVVHFRMYIIGSSYSHQPIILLILSNLVHIDSGEMVSKVKGHTKYLMVYLLLPFSAYLTSQV